MKFLSAEEATNLDLTAAREAALNYSKVAGSLAHEIEVLRKGYETILARVESDKQQRMFAEEVLKGLQRQVYGQSSERRLGDEIKAAITRDKKSKERERHGPKAQPSLPIIEVKHELSASERACKACGGDLVEWTGQFEASERIQVIPARFVLEKHLRQKYRCACGGCIKTAPGPLRLKEGGRYSPEFGVEVGISKYEHHLPLERQVKMMAQAGLNADSQTLFAQIDTIAWYLAPKIYEAIATRVRNSPFACADETPWKNLGKGAKRKFYLWGARTRDAVYFQIADSRNSEVAKDLLSGFEGVVMCDGYRGYNPIASETRVLAHCWSHVRRKFVAAETAFPAESKEMIDLIRDLYAIEDDLKAKNASWDEIRATRQERSIQVTEKIYQKLWELKNRLPQSSLGKAVDYTLKLWRGLLLFIDYPQVPLDNNAMERAIRGPVTGRKNHFGSKNLKTAEVASVWYSVIETCKAQGVDPKAYLNAVVPELLRGEEPKMPWEWAPKQSH